MMNRRFTRLAALLLAGGLWAGTAAGDTVSNVVLETFADGDAADDSPLSWYRRFTSMDLVVTNATADGAMAAGNRALAAAYVAPGGQNNQAIQAPFPESTLAATGDRLNVTFDFRLLNYTNSDPDALKFGLGHQGAVGLSNPGDSTGIGTPPEDADDVGYRFSFASGNAAGVPDVFLDHGTTNGLLGGSADNLGAAGTAFAFTTDTVHSAAILLERTATGIDIDMTIYDAAGQGGNELVTLAAFDGSPPTYAFDLFAMGDAFDTKLDSSADGNAYAIDNVSVELVEGEGEPPVTEAGDYNVLFIAADDLKPLTGAYGIPEMVTPHMDRLADAGVLFDNVSCQYPVCTSSRSSILTGLRPDTIKVWDLTTHFRWTVPDAVTLPQHFGNHGYRTANLGKIFDGRAKDAVSWNDAMTIPWAPALFYEPTNAFREDLFADFPATNPNPLFANSTDAGWTNPRNGQAVTDLSYTDGAIATAAVGRLEHYLATSQKYFFAVGFLRPHLPFNAPKAYWDLYDPMAIDLTNYSGVTTYPTGTLSFVKSTEEYPQYFDMTNKPPVVEDANRLVHGYMACVSYIDAQVGKLFNVLDTFQAWSNTIVLLWGDHGFHLGDHSGFWAKHSMFEQSVRSPLMVYAPGMEAYGSTGAVCEAPVEFVDVYPTLSELAGLPDVELPAGIELEGKSLVPLLRDPDRPWTKGAFSQYARAIFGSGITNSGPGMGYTLRTRQYRYTEWWRTAYATTNAQGAITDKDVKLFGTPEFVELYDYRADPEETLNLATNPAYATVRSEMAGALAAGNGWTNEANRVPGDYPTNWPAWQAGHVTPGYGLSAFAPEGNPDGDIHFNLFEYLFGTHPLEWDPDQVAWRDEEAGGGRSLSLYYPLVPDRTDAVFSATFSPGLNTPAWTAAGITTHLLETGSVRNLYRSRQSIEVPGQGFMRYEARVP